MREPFGATVWNSRNGLRTDATIPLPFRPADHNLNAAEADMPTYTQTLDCAKGGERMRVHNEAKGCPLVLRDELLNETLFPSLSHVRATAASWRTDYNLNRPHSRLGWLTPAEYADTFNPRRDLPLRSMASSASAPVAHSAQMGKTNRQSLHHAG